MSVSTPQLASYPDGDDYALSYVDVLLEQINIRRISLRELSEMTGIYKSRLGILLHRRPSGRAVPSLVEFHRITQALGMTVFEVLMRVDAIDNRQWQGERYVAVFGMLSRLFRSLPKGMIAALEDLDEMDGTEIRPDWSIALERAVVKRVVQEVNAIAKRRSMPLDFSF